MKTIRYAILCLAALLLIASAARAQGLSKYRGFSLGTDLETVLKQTGQKLADATVTHPGPALFQEVTWWPPNVPGPPYAHTRAARKIRIQSQPRCFVGRPPIFL